eukprot:8805581-Pyramimonas_sp.AAC.1
MGWWGYAKRQQFQPRHREHRGGLQRDGGQLGGVHQRHWELHDMFLASSAADSRSAIARGATDCSSTAAG